MVFCYINLLSAALAFQHIVLNLPNVTTCWWPVFKTTVMCTGVNCKRLFWLSASVIMSHCAWCVAKWANIEWSSSAVNVWFAMHWIVQVNWLRAWRMTLLVVLWQCLEIVHFDEEVVVNKLPVARNMRWPKRSKLCYRFDPKLQSF